MLSTTKAAAGLVLAAAGALAFDGGAAIVTPGLSCGGDNPCAPQVSAVPTCATSCIESAASNLGCVGDDYSCHCAKYDAIQNSAINCVLGACGLGGALQVPDAVGALCSCVTANPTTPCNEPTSSALIETTTSTSTIDTTTSTSRPPNPTPTSASSSPSSSSTIIKPEPTPTTPTTTTPPPTTCPHPCAPSISAVPACATSCIVSAASAVGCSDNNDYPCRCASSAAIQQSAVGCVLGACALDEALRVVDAVGALCACVTASPVTGCGGDGEGTGSVSVSVTETVTGSGGGGVTETGTSTTEGEVSSSGFVTETRTDKVTTSVCESSEETVTPTAGPTCSLGCDGGDGDDDDGDDGDDGNDGGDDGGEDGNDDGNEDGNGDGGGNDGSGEGEDDNDEDDSWPGPSPSSSPSGIPGGDGHGGDNGNDSGAGGGSTTLPTPPVETAGASNIAPARSGSLAALIAAAVALL
ncbi:uncharacterized protein B0H64DRAFT_51298 [Chaetomium fimeti]|uniref:CFEM domain-containing protein n=1 Tax=Chaetomium fimeti TaxID=1854472 RepID=A0AAE0LMW6_9PEZI|nr:hypothetical protein B0H64DRAFT_51298 [Chaetomium fimeti]